MLQMNGRGLGKEQGMEAEGREGRKAQGVEIVPGCLEAAHVSRKKAE